MRVLLVRPGPSFSVQDVAFGWRDGLLELGVTVGDFNFDDRLDLYASMSAQRDGEWRKVLSFDAAVRLASNGILAECYKFLPDVVIFVSGLFMPLDMVDCIRARGSKVVILCTESPYEDDRQVVQAEHADVVVLNDPTNLERFRAVNRETFYVPHAYDPKRHSPGPAIADLACDFAFVGTGFASRVEFLERVDFDGLDVKLGGAWMALPEDSPLAPLVIHDRNECMDNTETVELYRSAKTSLNLYRREANDTQTADGWSMGPREVELAATGCWFARDPRPEGDDLFPMLPTFTEPGEIRPLLEWALSHPDEREEAVLKAQAAIADRTFRANAEALLQHIGD